MITVFFWFKMFPRKQIFYSLALMETASSCGGVRHKRYSVQQDHCSLIILFFLLLNYLKFEKIINRKRIGFDFSTIRNSQFDEGFGLTGNEERFRFVNGIFWRK